MTEVLASAMYLLYSFSVYFVEYVEYFAIAMFAEQKT